MTPEIVLKAKNIHKAFTRPVFLSVLKGIDLEVVRGETIAIMGRSGEGKSTLLQILGTLEPPTKGSLSIVNQAVSPFNKAILRNRHIGFVFQAFHLLEDYTVLENVLMPARIARKEVKKGSEQHDKALDLLEKVGLSQRLNFNIKLLSGGEKQRAAIARALCHNPNIIFADEPSGNLDRKNAEIIHELLLTLAAQDHKALIIVTHNHELSKLCQKRYYLQDGTLAQASSNIPRSGQF